MVALVLTGFVTAVAAIGVREEVGFGWGLVAAITGSFVMTLLIARDREKT